MFCSGHISSPLLTRIQLAQRSRSVIFSERHLQQDSTLPAHVCLYTFILTLLSFSFYHIHSFQNSRVVTYKAVGLSVLNRILLFFNIFLINRLLVKPRYWARSKVLTTQVWPHVISPRVFLLIPSPAHRYYINFSLQCGLKGVRTHINLFVFGAVHFVTSIRTVHIVACETFGLSFWRTFLATGIWPHVVSSRAFLKRSPTTQLAPSPVPQYNIIFCLQYWYQGFGTHFILSVFRVVHFVLSIRKYVLSRTQLLFVSYFRKENSTVFFCFLSWRDCPALGGPGSRYLVTAGIEKFHRMWSHRSSWPD